MIETKRGREIHVGNRQQGKPRKDASEVDGEDRRM